MRMQLIGNKIGMTQVFDEGGVVIPVTVLKVGPCFVIRKKNVASDGYSALVIGYEDAKEKNVRKSEHGLFQQANIAPKRILKEIRVTPEELDSYDIGQELKTDLFKKGEFLDITAKSKGRGFTGVMKRHRMAGAKSSHGTHEYFRHGGSIGSSAYPARVFRGQKMAGRFGGTQVTIQNLRIVDVRPKENILLIKGTIPGPNRDYIFVSQAVKKVSPVQ